MGHRPPKTTLPAPTREDFLLGVARQRYLNGRCDVDEFERLVGRVLSGKIPSELMGGLTPFRKPAMEEQLRG